MPRIPASRAHAVPVDLHLTARLLAVVAAVLGVAGILVAAPSAHAATARPHHHRAVGHHRHHRHHRAARHHHRHRSPLGPDAGRVARAMSIAVAQHGKPYVYGAAGPRAFDCSGLTSYAYHRAGFPGMPRTAAAQAHFARHIPRDRMHRGDLIFFTGGGSVYHVGLFAGIAHGRRLVLNAPYPGQRVRTQPLWTDSWFPGTLRFR
jgi:cell wall-associated NlpC family hydrolase